MKDNVEKKQAQLLIWRCFSSMKRSVFSWKIAVENIQPAEWIYSAFWILKIENSKEIGYFCPNSDVWMKSFSRLNIVKN